MLNQTDANAVSASERSNPSPFGRAALVFFSPSRAFERLDVKPGWWLPFVIVVLVGLGYATVVGTRVGWGTVARNNTAQSPKQQARMDRLPAAQQEAGYAVVARITRVSSYAICIVGPLLFGAIVAGVFLGTLNFGFGGRARFSALFAAYQYAALPQALKLLLVIAVLAFGVNGDTFQMTNPLGSNPSYYFLTLPRPLYSLLSWVDVFAIWEVALLVIGCAAAAKVSRGKAAGAVLGWTVLFALVGAGLASFS